MKFGILGAMPQEVALMARAMTVQRTVEVGNRTFYEGRWGGHEIVLAYSRIGKVAAAVTTLLHLERFGASHIIFTGVAGAVANELQIGDVVIADQLVQHDMDASPLFPRFEVPLLGRTKFSAPLSDNAFAAARTYLETQFASDVTSSRQADFGISRPKVHRGLIVSGDQFLSDPEATSVLRSALPEALCTEMEGAAVSQVCHEMGDVPHAIIRVISDRADHGAAVDFQRFIDEVAEHVTGGIVRTLLESFPKPQA